MSVKKLYSELWHDTFQELYNPNFYTPLQNLHGIKFVVKFLTLTKYNLCIAHQPIAS